MVFNFKDYLFNIKIMDEDGFFDNFVYILGYCCLWFLWIMLVFVDMVEVLIKIFDFLKVKFVKVVIVFFRVGFVYNGQGVQWWVMGRELIEVYFVFKVVLFDCNKYLEKFGVIWNMIGMFFLFVLEMLGF